MVRDPRKDPRPGDTVLYGPQWQLERVEVVDRGDNYVTYKGQTGVVFTCLLSQWVEWARDAEVLYVAD